MKKIFTILLACLTLGAFAATEPAWYNDVTSITNNGQYYIYSVNGAGFMQAGNAAIKTINQNTYNTTSGLLFTIVNPSGGNVYNGSNYLYSYQAGSTCGPVHKNGSDKGTNIVWTLMENGSFWNIHSLYDFLGNRYAALYYTDGSYNAVVKDKNPISQNRKDTYTDVEYQWYVISQAHYDRHWAIYLYDRYKESISDYTKWENLVPAAYYTALADAYAVTYNVKNAEHSKETVNAHRADLKALYENAAAVAEAYANAKDAINALEAVEDKGEDATEVTAGISNARTAIEQAMSVDALNAAVSAPALKAIDPITFTVTTFTALEALGTPASTAAGRAITYDAADKTIINAAGQPIHKGTTTLTATAAATNDYYKFVRSAQVTVNALPTSAEENKTITYGAAETWNGYDLSTYAVGSHSLVYETTNAQGGVHTITLTLTVNKIEILNVPVELAFCPGGSETYRGVEYTEAGTFPVQAIGATRDTIYNVTVTILQPTFGTDSKTIVYGAQESWNGIDLSEYTVGTHTIPFVTTNAAGCDSTVTLNLTVNKMATLEVPVELEFCVGGSETYRGVEYTEAGTFNVPAEGATRDTIYNVTVTILQPTFGTDSKTIVYGAQASWNGIDLSEYTVGTHQVPFVTTNAAGCDSTVTLNLTVNKMATLEVPVELEFCVGGSANYRGVEYTEAGTFNVPAEGATRDTVYVVTVNMLQPTTGTDTKTIVVGAEESWNGIALQDSTVGVHYVVYETTNVAGCDSTVTLTLTVTKANTVEVPVNLEFCAGDSAEYRHVTYTEAGVYPVLVEGLEADTLFTITVTVNELYYNEDEQSVTVGQAVFFEEDGWLLRGETPVTAMYLTNKADTTDLWFVYYGQTVHGCDSVERRIVTVDLLDPYEAEQELEFCEGDSVQYRGVWYAEAGEYPVYAEGEIRDTIINVIVTVHEVPVIVPGVVEVLAGDVVTLPEGEWYLYDMPVEGEYQTLRSDTMGLEFIQYAETEFGCEYIDKIVVVVTPNYEAIENVFVGEKAEKFFREGQLYIRRGEDIYTVTGERVE